MQLKPGVERALWLQRNADAERQRREALGKCFGLRVARLFSEVQPLASACMWRGFEPQVQQAPLASGARGRQPRSNFQSPSAGGQAVCNRPNNHLDNPTGSRPESASPAEHRPRKDSVAVRAAPQITATPNNGLQLTRAARCAPSPSDWGQSLRAALAAEAGCCTLVEDPTHGRGVFAARAE